MKRLFDLLVSATGLLALAIPFFIIAVAIKSDSAGPVFFRQTRVGKNGRVFRIHKFRSMVVSQPADATDVTVGGDARITRTGAWIRRWKMDELAQLIDVFFGTMSLVGPRPEVPKYVALYPEQTRRVVLSVKPGITDIASIRFRNENDLLAHVADPEQMYREKILPEKLKLQMEYVQTQSFLGDLRIVYATLLVIFQVQG